MSRRRSRATFALLVAGLSSIASCASGSRRGDDDAAIRRVVQGIIEADNAGDLERVVSHYTEDAVLLPPSEAPVVGIEAIRARYANGFDQVRFDLASSSEETRVAGDWAFDRGRTSGRALPRAGGAPRLIDDKYLMILRRERDGWRIARLMWSPNAPAR